MLNFFFDLRYPQNVSSEFAHIVYTVSYISVPENIIEWANNNVQRYIKLSTPMDEKLHRHSTV